MQICITVVHQSVTVILRWYVFAPNWPKISNKSSHFLKTLRSVGCIYMQESWNYVPYFLARSTKIFELVNSVWDNIYCVSESCPQQDGIQFSVSVCKKMSFNQYEENPWNKVHVGSPLPVWTSSIRDFWAIRIIFVLW